MLRGDGQGALAATLRRRSISSDIGFRHTMSILALPFATGPHAGARIFAPPIVLAAAPAVIDLDQLGIAPVVIDLT